MAVFFGFFFANCFVQNVTNTSHHCSCIASVSINILLGVINNMGKKIQENDKVVPKTQFNVDHNYTVMYL